MKLLVVFTVLILAYVSGGKIKHSRIINGILAKERQFPSQVGLAITKNEGTAWCGGSLITTEWILTAAHCVHKSSGGTAYFGMTKRGRAKYSVEFSDSDIIVHEDYKFPRNDIALIHIEPIRLTDGVSTIELANDSMTYDNSKAIAVGWGRTSDATSASPNLYYATLIVDPLSECTPSYGKLPKNNICVSTKSGKSTCRGDSGGPLISQNDGKLIGITSFGSKEGCEAGFPVVFTRVSSFLPWIRSNMGLIFT